MRHRRCRPARSRSWPTRLRRLMAPGLGGTGRSSLDRRRRRIRAARRFVSGSGSGPKAGHRAIRSRTDLQPARRGAKPTAPEATRGERRPSSVRGCRGRTRQMRAEGKGGARRSLADSDRDPRPHRCGAQPGSRALPRKPPHAFDAPRDPRSPIDAGAVSRNGPAAAVGPRRRAAGSLDLTRSSGDTVCDQRPGELPVKPDPPRNLREPGCS